MGRAGLVRTPEEDLVDYLRKVGEAHSRILRHDKRHYAGDQFPRTARTWQEAHVIACETERHQRDTEAMRHRASGRSGAMSSTY
eukprot:766173-Pyramimonas_sp.AAC.1